MNSKQQRTLEAIHTEPTNVHRQCTALEYVRKLRGSLHTKCFLKIVATTYS
ncbi:hypothetical protein JCM31598_21030 [Desulfonatronum parangueonense]